MIHPQSLGLGGEVLPVEPLPMMGQADMFIFNPELGSFHSQHIRLGIRGYFVEGSHRVGVCEVIEVYPNLKAYYLARSK